jgi:hypothetical protein
MNPDIEKVRVTATLLIHGRKSATSRKNDPDVLDEAMLGSYEWRLCKVRLKRTTLVK